ncbi:MAG: TIM-barrel domain-containing protein [Rikenellaceae bacterium]
MRRLAIFTLLLASSCSNIEYERDENSVTVVNGEMTIQMRIINDNIIQVKKRLTTAAPEQIKECVVQLEPQDVDWRVRERGGNLVVETEKIRASLSQDGEISYTTAQGKPLISELSDGTYITPITEFDNEVAQSFSVGDEALMGLGQYQNGLMNWRNTPVRLQQYNQEIAVPFVVSTAGYGIYWSNYSVTDFNLPQNRMEFPEVVDAKKMIKRGKFTPTKSGTHYFLVDSKTPKKVNRRLGDVKLIFDQDTVINYQTMWFPDSFSGRADLVAGKEYEVTFIDTGAQVDGEVLYSEPDYNRTRFSNLHGESIGYYIIAGETPAEVVGEYSSLTGKAPLFPLSAYGFWQCREAYKTQEQLLDNAKEYRKRGIPVDNIVQDWDYWSSGRAPEWDRSRYPNPRQMLKDLDAMNLNLLVSVWPSVNVNAIRERYNLKMMEESSYIDAYDRESAHGYYRALSDSMYKIGVQAIWTDGNEPIIEPAPESRTAAGEFRQVANTYSLHIAKALYEGHREEFPDKRVINFSRSSFSGQQAYGSMVWSGDVDGSWEQFREQITAGLNLTVAGIPYWTTDIGGFFRNMTHCNTIERDQYNDPNYRELLARWFEYGAFCPMFRIHGYQTETEVWRFGAEFEAIARKYIDLRYQLMPYIYSEARKVTENGSVIMSPMAYQYPEDKKVWNIGDQFMFGESIMVAPVTEYGARNREVYLPEGDWYNFWNDEKIEGGKRITVDAPLDQMPLFVKAGSIIPFAPKVQYATEPTNEPTTLKIYPGKDATFTLYYDDYTSYDYEQGRYSVIKIEYDSSNQRVTFDTPKGNYIDFANSPIEFNIEIAGTKQSKSHRYNGAKFTSK